MKIKIFKIGTKVCSCFCLFCMHLTKYNSHLGTCISAEEIVISSKYLYDINKN